MGDVVRTTQTTTKPCFATLIYFQDIFLEAQVTWNKLVQATTVLVETVLVETTVLVEQKPLTTQFYLVKNTKEDKIFEKLEL